jgi:hypothetical protein
MSVSVTKSGVAEVIGLSELLVRLLTAEFDVTEGDRRVSVNVDVAATP